MACLNITAGLFINTLSWQTGTAPVTTANGATVTLTPGTGCSIVRGADSEFFPTPIGGSVRFLVFGSPANFVAVLTVGGGVGDVTRSVVIVDTSGATLTTQLISTTSAPTSVSLPAIQPSQGNGSVFMVFAPMGSGALAQVAASIHRSVDGDSIVGAVPFTPAGQVIGNATATDLQILEGGTVRASAPRPRGRCLVVTNPVNFPEAVIGPGAPPATASYVRSTRIRNDGTDCLTINSISNAGPFSVSATTPALPATIDPGQEIQIDINFAPAAVGNFNEMLAINPTPAAGTTAINCVGRSRNAVRSISFGATLGFGTIVLGGMPATRNLVITNNGDLPVNLTVPSTPIPGTEFALVAAGFVGTIAPGASTPPIAISFTPTAEGAVSRVLTFTSDVPGSPHQVTLSGTACVARAQIDVLVPPGPNVNLGRVQRGFRTVKVIRVRNPGNGILNFRARTTGNALFGIQRIGDSITSPLNEVTFSVAPTVICGAGGAGSGEVLFAVTFFADAAPGVQTAQLVIDNHNVAAGAPASFTFDLEAEVIAVVNMDVELVMDRSGSMSDPSGPRRKIDTALDAARLFAQLARPDVDDRIGLSRFNTAPEQVQAMTTITAANQAGIVSAINEPNFSPGGGTSIAGGVIQAIRDMNANPRATLPPALNKAVVVLTDANDNTPYTNPDDGVAYSLLGGPAGGFGWPIGGMINTTAVTVPADVRLYGVGIGDDIDTGRLAQLCPTTGGEYLHVRDFNGLDFFKLEKHFTQIYMNSVNLAQISDPTFWIDPHQTHEHKFSVLRGDVSIMVVIYDRDQVRLPFWLLSPLGEMIEPTNIPSGFQIRAGMTNTARFVELRMPQGEPDRYAGQWKVVIRHDGKLCSAPGLPSASGWFEGKGQVSEVSDLTHTAALHAAQVSNDAKLTFGFSSDRCKINETDPAMYGIAIGAGSNFAMMPYVEPGVVKVGEPIRLNAVVSEFSLPVKDCHVTVEAKAPNGATTSLVLHDDGAHQDGEADDGDYGGLFTQTSQEGMYEFLFRAHGTSADREPVMREATLSKYVEGREKLVPDGGAGTTDGAALECCKKMQRWFWIWTILLILLVLLIWRM